MADGDGYDLRGFKPFGWDCRIDGCFNKMKRINFANFFDCFPRRQSFTDIDGAIERNGHFLFIDGKGDSELNDIKTGQRLFFEKLTLLLPTATAVIFAGRNEPLSINGIRVCKSGKFATQWELCDLKRFRAKLRLWSKEAEAAGR